jgi:hypothetical protein
MGTRPRRVEVAADVVGLGAVGVERDRHHRTAGDRHDRPAEPAEERTTARPARELRPRSLDGPISRPAAPASLDAARCRPDLDLLEGVHGPLGSDEAELVEHDDERHPRDAVRELEIRIGHDLQLEPARAGGRGQRGRDLLADRAGVRDERHQPAAPGTADHRGRALRRSCRPSLGHLPQRGTLVVDLEGSDRCEAKL